MRWKEHVVLISSRICRKWCRFWSVSSLDVKRKHMSTGELMLKQHRSVSIQSTSVRWLLFHLSFYRSPASPPPSASFFLYSCSSRSTVTWWTHSLFHNMTLVDPGVRLTILVKVGLKETVCSWMVSFFYRCCVVTSVSTAKWHVKTKNDSQHRNTHKSLECIWNAA